MLIENHQTKQEVIIEYIFPKFGGNHAGAGQRNVNAEVLRKTERGFINILPCLIFRKLNFISNCFRC